jgi:hypothetical protein
LREALAHSLANDGPMLLHVPVVEQARVPY